MVTYVVLAKFTDPGESGMRSSFSAGAFVCPTDRGRGECGDH